MKTIGLIGGMSWESSALYYAAINRGVRDRLGGSASARIVMDSCNFAEVERLQHAGDWNRLGDMLAATARRLQDAGADLMLLCTNTVHRLAPEIEAAIDVPLLHIADPLGEAIQTSGLTDVGLLGTAFTMEQSFLTDRLREKHGIACLVPDTQDRAVVHRVIYEELIAGETKRESRDAYLAIVDRLAAMGAQGVVLGCTEIGLLLQQGDGPLPLFDTAALHAAAAVDAALA
ncbi:aspartate/glutamate racemase family protein [Aurantiacibacter hainanensis]|uniref:aspartate/glutamate racemase family protein n=1 Tax=Aurantiacibacter hainanensis TaxID=3076114 RepID=UPI0030C69B6D